MELLPYLLPLGDSFQVNQLRIEREDHIVAVELEAIAPDCPCPSCRLPAERIHSHYQRTVADLPWADLIVRLHLLVRKFFCDNRACPRKIFTERLPSLVAPSARRSLRLMQQQQQMGLALGGNPGARLSSELDRDASRNTFLRLIRRLPLPEPPAPEIVGIDDWAWKKGQRYGTIITDLERQCPIALLEDRDAETLAAWLKQHPTIRIIARDRAGAYAEGATKGAPLAIQVADRFHLIGNLADTLLPVFEQHAELLSKVTKPDAITGPTPAGDGHVAPLTTEDLVTLLPPSTPSPKHQAQAEQRRAARLARYERARELHDQGWPIRAIGRELGLNRNTIRAYLRAPSFPERQPRVPRRPGVLDPFIPYLIERWNAGCRNGTALWKELIERGYTGKRVTVFSFITRLRKALGIPTKQRAGGDGKVIVLEQRPLTPRNAVWQVLQRLEKREKLSIERLEKLREAHPDLEEAISLSEDFTALVRARDPEAFDPWLNRAAASTLKPFQSLAASLRRDYDAVRAGIELPWSTGPVEGEINRLKMLKRAMFGRAGFPLLQRRVLLAG
jgi:transposase